MSTAKKHIIISTVLCALTLVVFLIFYGSLPESIPIHFDSTGAANSFWPRNVVVFGVPAVCVLLNLISGFALTKKGKHQTIYVLYLNSSCVYRHRGYDLFGPEMRELTAERFNFFIRHFDIFQNDKWRIPC